MSATEFSVEISDPINKKILEISEDQIQGFLRDPLGEISRQSGVDLDTVIERIRAMLRGGTIRRVRQTLLATNLAEGALVTREEFEVVREMAEKARAENQRLQEEIDALKQRD